MFVLERLEEEARTNKKGRGLTVLLGQFLNLINVKINVVKPAIINSA